MGFSRLQQKTTFLYESRLLIARWQDPTFDCKRRRAKIRGCLGRCNERRLLCAEVGSFTPVGTTRLGVACLGGLGETPTRLVRFYAGWVNCCQWLSNLNGNGKVVIPNLAHFQRAHVETPTSGILDLSGTSDT